MSPPISTSGGGAPYIPQIRLYQNWLARERGLVFADYDALWRWSTTDLAAFWQSVWDYFDLKSPTPHASVLSDGPMPHVRWFDGAQANYARQVLRHVEPAHAAGLMAVISRDETGHHRELSWPELRLQVASMALHLQDAGVEPGDRVAAYLPNVPETMVAFLACASIGAVWSVCAPDMGTAAVLDRFKQIEPKALIACDGVVYGGREIDRAGVVAELCAALPSLRHLVVLERFNQFDQIADATKSIASKARFTWALGRNDSKVTTFEPRWLPFSHPLWIVYSSGTTGLPKPIVHGHGGTVIVAMALKVLHNDIGCSYAPNSFGERYHWYSTTGWVMWNAQLSGLLNGTTCCLYDGSPAGSKDSTDWTTLWRFAADLGVTFFGAGAAFYANCMKAGVALSSIAGLSTVRALGTTGSPLSEDVQRWGTAQFATVHGKPVRSERAEGLPDEAPPGRRRAQPERETSKPALVPKASADRASAAPSPFDMWWCNISGGTDFAGAFIGGNRELPQVPGRMQCRLLGCAVEAWNEAGEPVIGEVGELVCTQPIPSMPLRFWGDEGDRRYLSSYFDMYPGVWRHGDWLKIDPDGGCTIYGRSDATINRHGLRMGTSEIYSAVEALPEVLDSMVVDLEYLGRPSFMPLFVVLAPGQALDEPLRARIAAAIKSALSPRFLPDEIVQAPEVPRTLSGKKQELPIKKLLLGQPLGKVVNRDAMANPGCLDWYVAYAAGRAAAA